MYKVYEFIKNEMPIWSASDENTVQHICLDEITDIEICDVWFEEGIISKLEVFRYEDSCIFINFFMGHIQVARRLYDIDVAIVLERNSQKRITIRIGEKQEMKRLIQMAQEYNKIGYVFLDGEGNPFRYAFREEKWWLFSWEDNQWVALKTVTEKEVKEFPCNLTRKEQSVYLDRA